MKPLALASLLLLAVACDRSDDVETDAVEADNTKKNARDRNDENLTPFDQGTSEIDIALTKNIRQAIVEDDDLSLTAKNIKVITRDGVVTLRGPVKSDAEKNTIGALAARMEHVKRVDNQLEVDSD
jgi:osmotically-inducible protein OsmY